MFANLGLTYVNQKARRLPTSSSEDGKSNFYTVDAGLGYRLPNRCGIISLQVSNQSRGEWGA